MVMSSEQAQLAAQLVQGLGAYYYPTTGTSTSTDNITITSFGQIGLPVRPQPDPADPKVWLRQRIAETCWRT